MVRVSGGVAMIYEVFSHAAIIKRQLLVNTVYTRKERYIHLHSWLN